jgi:phenylalanyl-tRNA synthetase beta chain
MKVVHEWLKEYVGESIPSVTELEELFMFHAFEVEGIEKVGGHEVIDLKILPDRASYCLSHRGIAHEIASITGVPLAYDPLLSTERLPSFDRITVDIADAHACTRFGAALVRGIEVKDSPLWLQERLIALGQRPINNIVDATNYVMYALGQPIHAYDAKKFPQQDGVWRFGVRFAQKDETVSLIAEGGKEGDRVVSLIGSELLIIDESSGRAIGLAGVKGGAFAGVDSGTKEIIIEAAHFDPIITRKTARRLGIVIDASKRFENDPSSELIPHALREVVALITKIAGGTCEGAIDINPHVAESTLVTVHTQKVNAHLGLSLSGSEVKALIERVGAQVAAQGEESFLVTAPFWRHDLTIEEDYIDEVGRLYGYEHVVSVVPDAVPLCELNVRHYYSEKLRAVLIGLGFYEVITSSFSKKDEVHLRNALASDKSYMRSQLRFNIKEVLDKNANLTDLLGAQDTRVFEIGTVFNVGEGDQVVEHTSLSLGVRIKVSGYSGKDDALVASVIETLEADLGVPMHFEIKEGIAECDLTQVLTALPVPVAYEKTAVSEEIVYTPFSIYPAVSRDIAFWVPEGITTDEALALINDNAGALRVRTTLVDVFSKEGRTSYAFRVVFQAEDRTLTDAEVNVEMDRVYAALQEKGFETR